MYAQGCKAEFPEDEAWDDEAEKWKMGKEKQRIKENREIDW